MNNLETVLSKLDAELEALSATTELSFGKALARANAIVGLARVEILELEKEGQFKEAATLYERFAKAFEIAARKVPEEERGQMASLGDYWSLKARTARLTPPPVAQAASPPRVEPLRSPIVKRLSADKQHQGVTSVADESKLSAIVRQQVVDLKKPDEAHGGRLMADHPTPLTDESDVSSAAKPQAAALDRPSKKRTRGWSATQPQPPSAQTGKVDRKPPDSARRRSKP